MVYDLGGGTFDATLLRLPPGKVHTLATDGDVQLGGHDWDQRLVDYAAEAFLKSHGLDPRQDPAALNRLFQAVMEAKHTLSARNRATIRIEYAGRTSEVQVTREQFEEMTADLLERTAYTSRQLLAAAGLQWQDVNRILLVGGSTRMPMVSRMLQKLTGIEPDRTVNPDEAVARGRRVVCRPSAGQTGPRRTGHRRFEVTNVNAHSLGVEGIEQETLRKTNVIFIPRNTALPARRMERFVTKSEGQRSIVIRVLEGESSLPGECTAIGRTVVRDLPEGLPKGWPVEVTFEYGANGRLSVRALVPGTHHQAELDLERDVGLSGAGIARWKVPVDSAAGFDAFEAAVQDVLACCRRAIAPTVGGSGIRLANRRPAAESDRFRLSPTLGGSPPHRSPLPLGTADSPRPLRAPGKMPRNGIAAPADAVVAAAGAPLRPGDSCRQWRAVSPADICRTRRLAMRPQRRPPLFSSRPPRWRVISSAIAAGFGMLDTCCCSGFVLISFPSLAGRIVFMTQPADSIPAVGIDLGTTFSVVARLDDRGQPVTLVNAEGDRLTPSVVLFDGEDVVVGKEAMKAMATEADHVAECAKRDMGHRVFHKVLQGKQYPPEVIQAWILNKLRVDARSRSGRSARW